MNAIPNHLRQSLTVAAVLISVFVFGEARAQSTQAPQVPLSYTVTDLGTLGGSTSTAFGGQQGFNQGGMIVGSSTLSDKSEHAFLYVDGQMYDLNLLCDLSTSDFKVLTIAKSIDDCLEIIGEGITTNGDKRAFLMTPTPVDGGRWCYSCCRWIWKQDGGGWQWENNSYQWHGAGGSHGGSPPNPPHCYWWPLPSPSDCSGGPPPPGWCYCCIDGHIYIMRTEKCQANSGHCFNTIEEAKEGCEPKWGWCCMKGKVVKMTNFECQKKGGQWFATEEDAIRNCKACWWCCLDGKVSQTTWDDCVKKGGQCYATEEEAKAHQKECTPKGWCCLDGRIFPSTLEDCQKQGGQFYTSEKEAYEHRRDCKPCWCCFADRAGKHLVQTTEDDCKRRGGQCFDAPEQARKAGCIPLPCWCCLDGNIFASTSADCETKGGQCFPSKQEAIRHQKDCKPMCWCCRPGRDTWEVIFTTQEDCRQHKGQCYGSEPEAKAHCNPTPTPTPTPSDCWCCIDMQGGMGVANTTPEDCKNRGACDCTVGSTCFATQQEAVDKCFPVWCCITAPDGSVSIIKTTEADCVARHNGLNQGYYPTKESAIAACEEPPGTWCCAPAKDSHGRPIQEAFPADAQECAAHGGQLFSTEAQALASCNMCWCCPKSGSGEYWLMEASACKNANYGAQCFSSKAEAMACAAVKSPTPSVTPAPPSPPICWVCIDRNAVQMRTVDAQARKLQYFNSKEEAQRSCGGGGTPPPSCWVCIDGKVTQMPEAEAQKRRVQCYRSEQEARDHCKAKTVWCCMDGQVVQVTEEECRARGGHAYRTEREARASCKGKTCWVCSDGRVMQLPEEQARARGMQCFGSREEATRSCKKEGGGSCWVCINGRVGQVTEAQARARGLQCFGSREEAASNCSGGGGPRPTPRPGRRR